MQNDGDYEKKIQDLEAKIRELESENQKLRLAQKNDQTDLFSAKYDVTNNGIDEWDLLFPVKELTNSHIERYSRQLLVQQGFGVSGQLKLLSSSVLVIGAGGIGSTVIPYLAACGVGRLTIIDFDHVDVSNLHRQIIHKTKDVGMNKAESACRAIHDLNPTIDYKMIQTPLTHQNALDLISKHDCVVDASDNPQTRYLVNDACVLGGKPLISASAIGTEGQLSVYNYNGGPCYRCLYPKASASEGMKTCADNGVLGPVPGLVGILQALETIKVLTGIGTVMCDKLLMYDSLRCSFLSIKKPKKQNSCAICGSNPTIRTMNDSYEISKLTRGPNCALDGRPKSPYIPSPISQDLTLSCTEYDTIRKQGIPHILLDVRVKEQFDLCSLEGAINLPLVELDKKLNDIAMLSNKEKPVYCMCRRGVLSVEATKLLQQAMSQGVGIHSVKNITGGLEAWRKEVDRNFPNY